MKNTHRNIPRPRLSIYKFAWDHSLVYKWIIFVGTLVWRSTNGIMNSPILRYDDRLISAKRGFRTRIAMGICISMEEHNDTAVNICIIPHNIPICFFLHWPIVIISPLWNGITNLATFAGFAPIYRSYQSVHTHIEAHLGNRPYFRVACISKAIAGHTTKMHLNDCTYDMRFVAFSWGRFRPILPIYFSVMIIPISMKQPQKLCIFYGMYYPWWSFL